MLAVLAAIAFITVGVIVVTGYLALLEQNRRLRKELALYRVRDARRNDRP